MDDLLIIDWQGLPKRLNRGRSNSGTHWVSFSEDTSFSWKGTALCSTMGGEQRSHAGQWWWW